MKHYKYLILLSIISGLTLSACQESTDKSAPVAEKPSVTVENPVTQPVKTTERPKVDRGARLYKRCATCHTLEKDGRHKVGPNLYGIFGAKAASKADFPRYSKAMKESGVTWTDENLAAYTKNPKTFMPGNGMTFVGIRNDADIELLLEYMRSKTSE